MQEIQRILRAAGRRLLVIGFLRALVVAGTATAGMLMILIVLEKLGPWTFRWPVLFASAAGVALLVSAIAAFVRRLRGLSLADELDRRAGLRETLSTAVLLADRKDAWSLAVTESAGERARRVVLPDVMPIRPPRRWGVPVFLLALSVVCLWFVPRHDLSGLLDRRAEEEARQAEIRTVALEIRSHEQKIKETLDRAGVELRDEKADDEPSGQGEAKSVEEIKRAALKKLTKLSDELNEMKKGDKARQLEAMRQSLRKLKSPGPGPLEEFSRNLARGNFREAKQALEELAKSLESGEMSEEQKALAAEQMRKLASQMERLAEQRELLKKALEQIGMDPKQAAQLASDPQALEDALKNMQGLSPEQIQSLLNQAMSQQSACESMQSMAGSMNQLAEAMQSGDMQSMQQLSQQLSAAEMIQCEMQAIDQALSQCNGQMAKLGKSMCENGGVSMYQNTAIGTGEGGSLYDPDFGSVDDYILKSEKTNIRNLGGPNIGSTLVYGAQVKGEAMAEFGEAVGASVLEAAEAIASMQVPREYHDAVRHYFGRLEALARQGEGEQKTQENGAPAG